MPTLYERIGGDAAITAFVGRLYDIMASDAEAEYIWKWHTDGIEGVKARLRDFLSGWLGGPLVYHERWGPPMMRRRHMGVSIGPKERDIWLKCARMALYETVPDAAVRHDLDFALTTMAEHMRNRDDDGQPASTGRGCGGECS